MVGIISDQGYPQDDQVLARVDYFIMPPTCEGGILIVGKDSQGKKYRPKKEPQSRGLYSFSPKKCYSVPIGENGGHPAIYFPFELRHNLSSQEIIKANSEGYDEFLSKFNLTLMDESSQRISLDAEIEEWFKYLAAWGAFELAGLLRNHFWGEMYRQRTPALEKFLEAYRGE